MGYKSRKGSLISDEQIIELFWQRNEKAIAEVDKKYRKYLLSIARNFTHDESDSEECLNDTYISAWNTIPPSRPALLQAYLASLMRRRAINCYNAKKRQKRISGELALSLTDLEELISDDVPAEGDINELGRIISEFTQTLTERRMYIFMSRYYVARPVKEISKLLGCSESTVNKEIAAIKCDLKKKLNEEGYFI